MRLGSGHDELILSNGGRMDGTLRSAVPTHGLYAAQPVWWWFLLGLMCPLWMPTALWPRLQQNLDINGENNGQRDV